MHSAQIEHGVPVGNVYRMLCYARRRRPELAPTSVVVDEFQRLEHLLARLIVVEVRDLLRRGIARGFREMSEDLRAPRGKIDLNESIGRQLERAGRVACVYDDLTADILANRVIKATLTRLSSVVPQERGELLALANTMRDVADVPLTSDMFRRAQVHSANGGYQTAIDLCELVFQRMVATHEGRRWRFKAIRADKREMGYIFEGFVRGFAESEQTAWTVLRDSALAWDFAPGPPAAMKLLPRMLTDLQLRRKGEHMVIETKFTTHAMTAGRDGTLRWKSSYMYQLHAYVTHLLKLGVPLRRAVLLIGHCSDDVEHTYVQGDVVWTIRAVDMRVDWADVHTRVLSVLENAAAS